MAGLCALLIAWCGPAASPALASDLDEFRIKRQEVYEFAAKPTVTVKGDAAEIRFAAKAACDVTVAIEDGQGQIVRHLACGVLGERAPEPFAKNTLEQALTWDGKDDQGRYLDNKSDLCVRVSLGLKAQLDRSLFWDPRKRLSASSPVMAAAPEGVYVFDGGVVDSVRLFDHDGNYVRTVYPFPADKLAGFKDLHWQAFPQDGARLPLKEGEHQATLLSSGDNTGFKTFGIGPKHQFGSAASTIAVGGGIVALSKVYLNRMKADGSCGDWTLKGPKTGVTVISRALSWRGGGREVEAVPTSSAISPDGQWLYLAGLTWTDNMGTGGIAVRWLHGVTRAKLASDAAATVEVFAGSINDRDSGAGDKQLHVPTAVACDTQGRVLVADHLNNRVQVFDAAGKLLRSIPATRPARIAIHHKTGELYVFSWRMNNYDTAKTKANPVKAVLTRLKSVDEPTVLATLPLPLTYDEQEEKAGWYGGREFTAALDSWTDPPTIWLTASAIGSRGVDGETSADARSWDNGGIRLLVEKDGRLVEKANFGAAVAASIFRGAPPANLRQRMYVNPKTGKLSLAEPDAGVGKSVGRLLEIDPESGKVRQIELPFDAEDFAYDREGRIYLRSLREIARYDPITWREVPLDYGEERTRLGFASSKAEGAGARNSPGVSALPIPVTRYNHHGGMMISARGHIVVGIHGGQEPEKDRREGYQALEGGDKYSFKLYPGRCTDGLVLVFDEHGKLIRDDAVPGLAFTHGTAIDKDDNIYVMAMAARVLDGQRYPNEATDTLMKFRPGKGRILSAGSRCPVAIGEDRPKRPPDLSAPGGGRLGIAWAEGADWLYGGLGFHARHGQAEGFGCDCFNSRFDMDYFGRSFAPEVDHYSVAVLDSGGNLILRIGRYGNVEDGKPLRADGGPAKPRAVGGDEVSFVHACYVAAHTDRWVYVADVGNSRIVRIKVDYHAAERVSLGDVIQTGR